MKNVPDGPDFGEAMKMDQALYQLAAYDAAHGLIIVPSSIDEAFEFQKAIAKKFNYFKRLIQNSEMSFRELQFAVVERNGPFPHNSHNKSIDEVLNDIVEEGKAEQTVASNPNINVLQKLFQDILNMSAGQQPQLISSNDPDNDIKDQMDVNPFLSISTDTPTDSDTPETRVLPNPNKDKKLSKGKNGRKSKSKNPESQEDT
jgi:hypothetical protein